MVLPLMDLCLFPIRTSVKNGEIRDLSRLSPKLRQRILKSVIMHGKINNPHCIRTLSNAEFLKDIHTLDCQDGFVDDHEYLDHVSKSLATLLTNGLTIGEGIVGLKLKMYMFEKQIRVADKRSVKDDQQEVVTHADDHAVTHASDQQGVVTEDDTETAWAFINRSSIFNLISQCPNLRSLDIRFVQLQTVLEDHFHDSILLESDLINTSIFNREALIPCSSVLNTLQELKLWNSVFFNLDSPIEVFKNLTTLSLVSCKITPDVWSNLENAIRDTLINLEIDFIVNQTSVDKIQFIQHPFPHLKNLKLVYSNEGKLNVENLNACPNLEQLDLTLISGDFTDHELSVLANLKANINLSFSQYFGPGEDTDQDIIKLIYDDTWRFNVIRILSDKITELILGIYWHPKMVIGLKHALDACQNLTSLQLGYPNYSLEDDPKDLFPNPQDEGWIKAMQILHAFFMNKEKAMKLRTLMLSGDFDTPVLDAVFQNCLNLDSLKINKCTQLQDTHFMDWASRGARPSVLKIRYNKNITSDGLIQILISSGDRLKILVLRLENRNCEIRNRIWEVLVSHCGHLDLAYGIKPCTDNRDNFHKKFFHGDRIIEEKLLLYGHIDFETWVDI